jgi:alkyl hydroperoxide reductase subunit D
MNPLDRLLDSLPEAAKDLRVNLRGALEPTEGLGADLRIGLALASAWGARAPELSNALLARARETLGDGAGAVIEDARAAAALMGMNNVYYRGKHMLADAEVQGLPARLRMQRLAAPTTSKASLELLSLAVSAVTGCEYCLQAHSRAVLASGMTREHVHEALRIAAIVNGTAAGLATREMAALPA